ncbi:discoidin domain-containing protein [Pyxidicoccus fallax]|uniref:Discoidin domain-containing protein n=1 Tax=Pyxidicoccus fallax TaxID=394095 RepID=A0A848LJ40_9BACT|nr:discoidin domain-containing protein [Pyxidicoccus fallax]NMO17696.1 discoidin domain-containing protein [Pyxidicoccus fallax]NPC80913.1 discoidin domain-containing protein [Pyxidicoccus fallax]
MKAWVSASSTLKSRTPGRYDARNAFDGNPATAWVEGAPGTEDAWLSVHLNKRIQLHGIVLWPGYTKSLTTFRDNAIPGRISIDYNEVGEERTSLRLDELYYRLEVVSRRGQSRRCASVAKDPVNLSPRLLISQSLGAVQGFKLSLEALPTDMHRPRYADLALSEWTPLFRIVDEEHEEFVEVPSPLTSPLREISELLLDYGPQRTRHPERLPLAPGARLDSFFDMSLPDLPDWAREALHADFRKNKAEPSQDALTQFGNAVSSQFFSQFVTVQSLADKGYRLIGGPFELRREVAGAKSRVVEYAYVFPVLTLNSAFQVTKVELKTSGLQGENCERSLPAL